MPLDQCLHWVPFSVGLSPDPNLCNVEQDPDHSPCGVRPMLGSQHVERCQVLVGHQTVSTLALGKSQDLIPLSSVEQRACVFIIELCQASLSAELAGRADI